MLPKSRYDFVVVFTILLSNRLAILKLFPERFGTFVLIFASFSDAVTELGEMSKNAHNFTSIITRLQTCADCELKLGNRLGRKSKNNSSMG